MKIFGIDGYGVEEICHKCGNHLYGNETCPNLHNGCLENMCRENHAMWDMAKDLEQELETLAHPFNTVLEYLEAAYEAGRKSARS